MIQKGLIRLNSSEFWSNLPGIARKPWVIFLMGLYVVMIIVISLPKSKNDRPERSDHYVIWKAGKNFFEHNAIYGNVEYDRPFTYSPFAAFLFQALHIVSHRTSAILLFLLNGLVLLPLTIFLLFRILIYSGFSPGRARMVLALALILAMKYIWNNLVMFQVNQIIFFFMVVGIYKLTRKKPHLAGLVFTVITLIKIIPVFLAAYVFFYHFSRKVATTMILTAMICLLLPAAMRGPSMLYQDYESYYTEFLKEYVVEGRILTQIGNHSLKGGLFKSIHPETRDNQYIYPEDYPQTVLFITIIQGCLLIILIFNGFIMHKRKVPWSLSYLASIILFTHLYSGITWTAHLVTVTFCILPFLLVEVKQMKPAPRVFYYTGFIFLLFLAIEGSYLVGENGSLFLRYYDIISYMLMGLFLFNSWVVWSRKSKNLYPEGVLI